MSLQRHTNQSGPAKTIAKKSKASTTVKKGCGRLTGRGLRFIPFGRFASEMPRDLVADGKAAPPSKEKLDKWLPLTAPLDWDYAGKLALAQQSGAAKKFDKWLTEYEQSHDLTEQELYDLDQYVALATTDYPDEEDFFCGDHSETPCPVPPHILYPLIENTAMLDQMSQANIHGGGDGVMFFAYRHGNVAMWAHALHPEGDEFNGEGLPNVALGIIRAMVDEAIEAGGYNKMPKEKSLLLDIALRTDFSVAWATGNAFGDVLNQLAKVPDENYVLFRAFVEATAGLVYSADDFLELVRGWRSSNDKEHMTRCIALIAQRNKWRVDSVQSALKCAPLADADKKLLLAAVDDKRDELAKCFD